MAYDATLFQSKTIVLPLKSPQVPIAKLPYVLKSCSTMTLNFRKPKVNRNTRRAAAREAQTQCY